MQTSKTDTEPVDQPVTNPRLTAHAVTPDRTLIIEEDNTDGWIASDLTTPITQ